MSMQALPILKTAFRAGRAANFALRVPLTRERATLERLARLQKYPGWAERASADAGGAPGEWIGVKGSRPTRTLLYLHGGGYCVGSPRTHGSLIAWLARACEARALALDYRLAPEHPFPAAVEDAKAAYKALLDRGVEPERIVVAGDSAGGGLTVVLLLALRDEGIALPAAGVCLSPWTDLTGESDSARRLEKLDPMIDRRVIRRFAEAYLNGQDARQPLASPLFGDLSGLPPLLIHVGSEEVLLDDAANLAKKAKEAGVDATLSIFENVFHVFHGFSDLIPEGRRAIKEIGAFVKEKVS